MLALKNVLARADHVPTLIFDEIDQGIGGRVGGTVGEKLWNLGRSHQVFVITHLPQLAVFGDSHYQVQKVIEDGRTLTRVTAAGGRGAHPRVGGHAGRGERGEHPLGARHPAGRGDLQEGETGVLTKDGEGI